MYFDLKDSKYDIIEIHDYDKVIECCILYDKEEHLTLFKIEENYYFYFGTKNMENFFFRKGIIDEKNKMFVSFKYDVVYFNIFEKKFKNILLKKGKFDD